MVIRTAVSSAAVGGDVPPHVLMTRASEIASVIEITVGAAPGYNHAAAAVSAGLDVIVHHAFPASSGRILNPEIHRPEDVLDGVASLGSSFYSLHPAKGLGGTDLFRWAESWINASDSRGIALCFETMNPVASSSRILRPHSLDCGPEVLSFAEFLLGTSAGLLADLSHILIGVRLGLWDLREVESMSATGKVMALHVSSPRLTKDAHMPHIGDRSIETLRTMIDVSGIMYEIDEGRRSYHAK